MGLKNPYHPYNKMSAYTVSDDDSFFNEKTIICSQKLNRIFQLRLMTLYPMIVYAPAQIISAPAQLITAPAQPPATGAVVYTALFKRVMFFIFEDFSGWKVCI